MKAKVQYIDTEHVIKRIGRLNWHYDHLKIVRYVVASDIDTALIITPNSMWSHETYFDAERQVYQHPNKKIYCFVFKPSIIEEHTLKET